MSRPNACLYPPASASASVACGLSDRVVYCAIQQLADAIALIVASKEPCCQALIDESAKNGSCLATSGGAAVPYNSSSSCCHDLTKCTSLFTVASWQYHGAPHWLALPSLGCERRAWPTPLARPRQSRRLCAFQYPGAPRPKHASATASLAGLAGILRSFCLARVEPS